jgi:hypothetical protein
VSKTKTKAVKTEPVGTEVVEKKANTAVAVKEASPELVERLEEAKETLAHIGDDLVLPVIRLTNDGFEMSEGAEPIEEFLGTIIFAKKSNVYYKGRYKSGSTELPDCASSDGLLPNKDIEKPVHKECKTCPYNAFGSADDGDGKKCKNTQPLFILVDNDGETGIMPKVLRVPPTSLVGIRTYLTNIACDYGLMYSVKTRISLYKKEDTQAYFNIRFGSVKRLGAQDKVNAREILTLWKPLMVSGMFGADMVDVTPEEDTPQPPLPEQGEVRF